MLNKIILLSLRNRLTVLAASVLLMIVGAYTAFHTEVDVFPDLTAPTVVVMTEAHGMAAEEVEQLVTFPIETIVNGATHVRRVRSSSTNGFSIVWVEFDWDTDIYLARQIVSEKLTLVNDQLPQGIGTPTMGPQSSILGEVLIVGLTADSTSMMDLRTIADWTLRPRLLSTGGVAQVAVLGGDIKEYQINLDPTRMKHYGVTLGDVARATDAMNQNVNGGIIYQHNNEYIVRGMLSTTDIATIARSVVKTSDAGHVFLEDIADVVIGSQEPKLGLASERGKPAVLLTVTKQPQTGTIELTDRLLAAIDDVKKNLPPDVNISTDIFQQSHFINHSIDNVKTSLYEGTFFVVIVLFLFLANIRTTFISLITLPLSLVVTILVLHYLGLSINTMSLGGIAIAIGSLVDDAIVDVENVWKHITLNKQLPKERQRGIIEVVFEASREVRFPILNSTLIIIVSFVPLFFLTGIEGRMLVPLGIAFIVSLVTSTIVALTLTPVLCSYLLKSNKAANKSNPLLLASKLRAGYLVLLKAALNHRRIILFGVLVACIVAVCSLFSLGRSFLPPFNEGSLTINISSMPGISLEESDRMGRQAEMLLMSVPEIKTVARKTGRAELDEHSRGVNASEIEAPYELTDRSRNEMLEEVREKLNTIVGANIEIGQPISHRIDAMLSGTRAGIAIKLFGHDLNRMYQLANDIKSAIADVPGLADLNVEQLIERPQLKIIPRREALALYGITIGEFAQFVEMNLAGAVVSQVYEQGKTFNLVVRTKLDKRQSMDNIKDLFIDTHDGKKVAITDVAQVVSAVGPNAISRENVKRKIVISANTHDVDLQTAITQIQERIQEKVTFPEGYHIEFGGQFESEQAASRTLLITSVLSIAVIFLLLYMQFGNVMQSAVVLVNLPLALIGGIMVLACGTGHLSIPAIIGFISLFGIATRNGLLLISHYNHLHEQGVGLRQRVLNGSADRLNPILMTALSSALALVPLAINGDLPGNEIQSPMAKVILGGLLSSTLLNAFVVPIVYEWLSQSQQVNKPTA
ncbi:MAG: efflux RND transporter permease subunit [Bacteroidaceae bacterium]|nr:efflux RND transporter permease subunit [Bacteroidaceae bacterium]